MRNRYFIKLCEKNIFMHYTDWMITAKWTYLMDGWMWVVSRDAGQAMVFVGTCHLSAVPAIPMLLVVLGFWLWIVQLSQWLGLEANNTIKAPQPPDTPAAGVRWTDTIKESVSHILAEPRTLACLSMAVKAWEAVWRHASTQGFLSMFNMVGFGMLWWRFANSRLLTRLRSCYSPASRPALPNMHSSTKELSTIITQGWGAGWNVTWW